MHILFQDIQVYRYYRDLINFKTRGNPGLMLRCINPLEAKLLDAASGIHIKFRLAGVKIIFVSYTLYRDKYLLFVRYHF